VKVTAASVPSAWKFSVAASPVAPKQTRMFPMVSTSVLITSPSAGRDWIDRKVKRSSKRVRPKPIRVSSQKAVGVVVRESRTARET
jgi:hypothetical protein